MASNPNTPIHPSFHERISVRVESQLPQFVKEDHPTFIAFLEAYYEYLEQTGKPYEFIGDLRNYFNIDKTVDDFLKYFKTQFAEDVPEAIFVNANRPQVLKKIRDFYRSKGSEKSFQFLFRLLFKEEIEFYFPSVDILRVSDGRFTSDKIIRVIDTTGTGGVYNLIGKMIVGSLSGAKASVELILNEQIGVFEVSTIYLSGVVGSFVSGETITDGTNIYTLGGMITGYTITNPGNNYSLSSTIPISGGGGLGANFIIDKLSSGSITTATIVSGGSGYIVGDYLTIDNTDKLEIDGRTASVFVKTVDGSGAITSLEIENGGYGYTTLPLVTGGGTGTNASITLAGQGIGGIRKLKQFNNGFNYTSVPTMDLTSLGDGTATIVPIVSGYDGNSQERWVGDDGQLSAANYIQDSSYYQAFSYVIKSSNTIGKWKDVVKRLIHPAGLALFGETLISSLLVSNLKVLNPLTTPIHQFPWTIVFHEGDISPARRLNNQLYQTLEEFPSGGAWPNSGYQNGNGGTSAWHIYRKELPVINLSLSNVDDYGFVAGALVSSDDYGLATDGTISLEEDYGIVTAGSASSLFLGPLRRQIDRQKFNREGGISKSLYRQVGSGYTSPPTVMFSGDGNGAAGTAIIGTAGSFDGTVTDGIIGITITNAGTGYTKPPTITLVGGGGSGAVAKAKTPGTTAVPAGVTGAYMVEITHSSYDRSGVKPPHVTNQQNYWPTTFRDLGGGYSINDFKEVKIEDYINEGNLKTKIVMNSDITLV